MRQCDEEQAQKQLGLSILGNWREGVVALNHLFSGSHGPCSHVYLWLHVTYTVHSHIYRYICHNAGDAHA